MALNSIKRKKLILSSRDKSALIAIYHTGIIAAGHLVRLFWQGGSYGYLRLRMLADTGFVGTKSFQEALPGRKRKKRKISSFYHITSKGIGAIRNELEEEPRPPWKNCPSEEKYFEHYHMGELWCRLYERGLITPQNWLPSRLAKRRLHIAPYTPLHSIVVNQKNPGEKNLLAFYYLSEDVKRQGIMLVKNLLPRIVAAGINKHFIICANRKTTKQTLKIFTTDFPRPDIYVLEWKNAIENLSAFLEDKLVFYRELAGRLRRKHTNINFRAASPLESAPYFFIDNIKIYASELISGNLATLARMQHRGYDSSLPKLFYAYLPDTNYFHVIKNLLPEDIDWLQLVAQSMKAGEDIYQAVR